MTFEAAPDATPAWETSLLAPMDNLLLGRPGPNLLPPTPVTPPMPPLSLTPPDATRQALAEVPPAEIVQRELAHPPAHPPAYSLASPPESLLTTPARPERIKGTALEQELLAEMDRLLLGRPGPNTDFLALAAQAQPPLQAPDQAHVTPPATPPVRPVVAPRTRVQQTASEPARKPTFEVTIGRLEVIAPPPEIPQQQPSRRPAPKTSLQDYLDRRRVGR